MANQNQQSSHLVYKKTNQMKSFWRGNGEVLQLSADFNVKNVLKKVGMKRTKPLNQ